MGHFLSGETREFIICVPERDDCRSNIFVGGDGPVADGSVADEAYRRVGNPLPETQHLRCSGVT
jgi:hypothetical protein